MAGIQARNGSYPVQFNYWGKRLGFTIGRVTEAAQVDYLLMRLEQGLIEPPSGDSLAFFKHDGTPPASTPSASVPRKRSTATRLPS